MPQPSQRFPKETSKVLNAPVGNFDIVEFVGHALQQMEIRGISEEDVVKTLRNPDKRGLPTEEGRERVRRNKTVRVAIDVVYEELPDRIRVITAIRINRRIAR